MGMPVLIIGKSGSGKSAGLRNFMTGEIGIINVMGKPLPFRSNMIPLVTTDYNVVKAALRKSVVDTLVIDDAGYLITNHFMSSHASAGKGNGVFAMYNELADNFYDLIRFIVTGLPPQRIVYIMMHEEKNDMGDIKPKTIGKLLDEKVCIEGLFTVVLRAVGDREKHVFLTHGNGLDVAKTPMGMFEDSEIENDLKAVDAVIRTYYDLQVRPRQERQPNKNIDSKEKIA